MPRRSVLLLLLWGAVLAPPSTAQSPTANERLRLANGLEVVLHRLPAAPVVTVMTVYRVGSRDERPGRSGFAHLFEHLMQRASAHVSAEDRAARLVAMGGGASATTGRDRTTYTMWGGAAALEQLVYLDAERMGQLLGGVTQELLDRERNVVMNERRERVDNAAYGAVWMVADSLLYTAGHPYRRPPLGSMADLRAATLEDVREFHRTYYVPANASVVISGDIDLARTRRLVERWYGAVPAGAEPPRPTMPVALAPPETTAPQLLEVRGASAWLMLFWQTPGYLTAGDAAMDVAARVLSNGVRGRLHEALVRTGLAQEIGVAQASEDLASTFRIVAILPPGRPVAPVAAAIATELERLRNEPIGEAELAMARGALQLNRRRALESTGGSAQTLSSALRLLGLADAAGYDAARYDALTPAAVRDAVRSFLRADGGVTLSVVPAGRADLALPGSTPTRNVY